MNVTAALLAIFALKPMRAAHHARDKNHAARLSNRCPQPLGDENRLPPARS
jgi:hypothetical protein